MWLAKVNGAVVTSKNANFPMVELQNSDQVCYTEKGMLEFVIFIGSESH